MLVLRRINQENFIWYLIKYYELFYWIEQNSIPESKMKLVMIKYSNNAFEEVEPSLADLSVLLIQNKVLPNTVTLKDIIKELNQLNIENLKAINNLKNEISNSRFEKLEYKEENLIENKEIIKSHKLLSEKESLMPESSKCEKEKIHDEKQRQIESIRPKSSSGNITEHEFRFFKERIIELNNLLKIFENEVFLK